MENKYAIGGVFFRAYVIVSPTRETKRSCIPSSTVSKVRVFSFLYILLIKDVRIELGYTTVALIRAYGVNNVSIQSIDLKRIQTKQNNLSPNIFEDDLCFLVFLILIIFKTFFQIVVFDQVLANYGKSYRQSVGVFVTPYNGLYQFHMHIHTRKSFIAEVTLRVSSYCVLVTSTH